MAKIRIMFSRYSAFYSPLIVTEAGGFLAAEGLEAEFSVAGAGAAPRARLADGSVELIQSAPSASWTPLERGESSEIVHFAQINQRDGFFIAARRPDPDFAWQKLEGAGVLADHGGQPLAMLRYALHRQAWTTPACTRSMPARPSESHAASNISPAICPRPAAVASGTELRNTLGADR